MRTASSAWKINFEAKAHLTLKRKTRPIRIDHLSWWREELPSEENICRRRPDKETWTPAAHRQWTTSHSLPPPAFIQFSRHNVAGHLTDFLRRSKTGCNTLYWLFGHYLGVKAIDTKHPLVMQIIADFIEKAVRKGRRFDPPPFPLRPSVKKISHHWSR